MRAPPHTAQSQTACPFQGLKRETNLIIFFAKTNLSLLINLKILTFFASLLSLGFWSPAANKFFKNSLLILF
jgi:hypothetical protein